MKSSHQSHVHLSILPPFFFFFFSFHPLYSPRRRTLQTPTCIQSSPKTHPKGLLSKNCRRTKTLPVSLYFFTLYALYVYITFNEFCLKIGNVQQGKKRALDDDDTAPPPPKRHFTDDLIKVTTLIALFY